MVRSLRRAYYQRPTPQVAAVHLLSVNPARGSPLRPRLQGTVDGVPVVFETARLFFGIEHPMSNQTVSADGQVGWR